MPTGSANICRTSFGGRPPATAPSRTGGPDPVAPASATGPASTPWSPAADHRSGEEGTGRGVLHLEIRRGGARQLEGGGGRRDVDAREGRGEGGVGAEG